jgi:hypothetical protein
VLIRIFTFLLIKIFFHNIFEGKSPHPFFFANATKNDLSRKGRGVQKHQL